MTLSKRERLERWLDKMIAGKRREPHSGGARETHDERAAERLLNKGMELLGSREADLKDLPLGCPEKVALAWWLRKHTTVSLRWAADRLKMGHYQSQPSSVAGGPKAGKTPCATLPTIATSGGK